MGNSQLICYTKLSPNRTHPRDDAIKKITIHHMEGDCSIEECGEIFASREREASSNYGIGTDGRIALYVDEGDRSWASSSPENDNMAVTIEVANDTLAPTWTVSNRAMESLIRLCVDICQRNHIESLVYTGDASGNLTMHKWFRKDPPAICPGPYLESRYPFIASEVNRRLHQQQ